jgi:signal transduction histidine kinase/ABC-type branched-subunit amino acid transport system ATPase component
MEENKKLLLQMSNIHVNYKNTPALNGVDFNLFSGEIHAITGEHRAGKSTLIKILSGAERPRSGKIVLNGKRISYFTPKSAMLNRIGTVYQNSAVIGDLEPLDFIYAHQLKTHYGLITYRKIEEQLIELMEKHHIYIDYKNRIRNLPVDQQYLIEFLRALSIDPQILILDEFSTKLTPNEMQNVYRVIESVKDQGCAIIYISHDIQEVIKLADRVTILNKGRRLETDYVVNLDSVRLYELTYSFSLDKHQMVYLDKLALFNNQIRKLINDIPLAIFISDVENQLQTLNTSAKNMLEIELPTKTNISNLEEILCAIFPKDFQNIMAKIDAEESFQWFNLQSASNHKLAVRISPIKDEGGMVIGSLLLIEDLELDESVKEYLIKTEKFASIAEMAVGVAHEINNPLFAIKNYLELISMKNNDSYVAEKLKTINTELDRIVRTVSTLLNFSKIKSEYFGQIDISTLIEDVLLLLSHQLNRKNIVVTRKISSNIIMSKGSEDKLKQLFINLILNSIDAILDYGKIQIEVIKENSNAIVRVKDNGNGIPFEIREKVFEPFYSTKINKFNTGLGLSISKHIVESHHGEVKIIDDPNFRTCIEVSFPL